MVSIDIKLKYVRNIGNINMNLHTIQIDMNKNSCSLETTWPPFFEVKLSPSRTEGSQ